MKIGDNDQPIMAVCGSSRFIGEIAATQWNLEKRGIMALGMNLLPHWYPAEAHHQAEAEGVASVVDELHLRKIDLADEVLVVCPGGYIGERTRVEIAYAKSLRKPVYYQEASAREIIHDHSIKLSWKSSLEE